MWGSLVINSTVGAWPLLARPAASESLTWRQNAAGSSPRMSVPMPFRVLIANRPRSALVIVWAMLAPKAAADRSSSKLNGPAGTVPCGESSRAV